MIINGFDKTILDKEYSEYKQDIADYVLTHYDTFRCGYEACLMNLPKIIEKFKAEELPESHVAFSLDAEAAAAIDHLMRWLYTKTNDSKII